MSKDLHLREWLASGVLAAALAFSSGAVFAAGPAFEDLGAEEQALLSGIRDRWDTLDEAQKKRLVEGLERYRALDPDAQARFRERARRWQAMDPERKARIRERYERFKALPPEEQARLKARFREFRELPASEREALRERFRSMSPEQRRAIEQNFRDRRRNDTSTR